MFSKVATNMSQYQRLSQMTTRAFRATAAANASKKPSIGDAVTILQSKVSGINQVVSFISARRLKSGTRSIIELLNKKKYAIFA